MRPSRSSVSWKRRRVSSSGMQLRRAPADDLGDRGLEQIGRALVAEPHAIVVEADQQHRHRRRRQQRAEVLLALLQLAGPLPHDPLEPQAVLFGAPFVRRHERAELGDRVVHEKGEHVGGVAAVVAGDLHREVAGRHADQRVGEVRDRAREPILALARRPQQPLELLGDGVEEERRGVVAIAVQRARQAVAELPWHRRKNPSTSAAGTASPAPSRVEGAFSGSRRSSGSTPAPPETCRTCGWGRAADAAP